MNPTTITDRSSYVNYLLSLGLNDWDFKRKLSEFDLKTKQGKEIKKPKKELTAGEDLKKNRGSEVNRLLLLGLNNEDFGIQLGDWDKKTGYDEVKKEDNISLWYESQKKKIFDDPFPESWEDIPRSGFGSKKLTEDRVEQLNKRYEGLNFEIKARNNPGTSLYASGYSSEASNFIQITAPNGEIGSFSATKEDGKRVRDFIKKNQETNQTEAWLKGKSDFVNTIKDNMTSVIEDVVGSEVRDLNLDEPLSWIQQPGNRDYYNDVRERLVEVYGEQRKFFQEKNIFGWDKKDDLLDSTGLSEYAQGKTFDQVFQSLLHNEQINTWEKDQDKRLKLSKEKGELTHDTEIDRINQGIIKRLSPKARAIAAYTSKIVNLRNQIIREGYGDNTSLHSQIEDYEKKVKPLVEEYDENNNNLWFNRVTGQVINADLETKPKKEYDDFINMADLIEMAKGRVAQETENSPYETLNDSYEGFILSYDGFGKYLKSNTIKLKMKKSDDGYVFEQQDVGGPERKVIETHINKLISEEKASVDGNGEVEINLNDFSGVFSMALTGLDKKLNKSLLYNAIQSASQKEDISTFFGTTIDNVDDLDNWVKTTRETQLKFEADLKGWTDVFLLNLDPGKIEKNEASLFMQGILDNTLNKMFIPADERGFVRGIASNHDNDRLERIQSVIAGVNVGSGQGQEGKAAVKFNQEQLDNFEMSFMEEFAYGTGSFVPMLGEIAAISWVTGGAMTATGAARALSAINTVKYLNVAQKGVKGAHHAKKLNYLTQANIVDRAKKAGVSVKNYLSDHSFGSKLAKVSGTPFQKGVYTMAYAFLEEGKMQLLDPVFGTDMPTGAGFGFYLGGAGARAMMPWRFTGKGAFLNPFLEKNILAGIGGATAAEVAAPLEAMIADLADHKDWKAFTEEHYKDYSTIGRRYLMNTMMFSLIGAHHWNLKTDFKSMAQKKILMKSASDKADLAFVNYMRTKDKKYLNEYHEHNDLYTNLFNQKQIADGAAKYDDVELLVYDTQKRMNKFNKDYQYAGRDADGSLGPKLFDFKIQTNRNGIDKGNVHQVNFEGKIPKIIIDARKLRRGILPHEIYHTVMREKFNSDPGMAKALRDKIQATVDAIYKELTYEADLKETSLSDVITDLYEKTQGKETLDEEYSANVVDLLQNPEFRNKAVTDNMIGELQQIFKGFGENLLYDTGLGKLKLNGKSLQERFSPDLENADDVIGFLARLGKSWGKGVYDPKMIKKFENIRVGKNGERLISIKTGKIIGGAKMGAKEIKESEERVYKSLQESLSKEYKGDKNKFLNTELSFESNFNANGKLINKTPVDDMLNSDFAKKLGGGFHPKQNRGLLEKWTKMLYDKTALDQRGMYKSGPNPRLDFKRDLMVEMWNLIKTKYDPARQPLDKYLSNKGTFEAFEFANRTFDQVHIVSKELEGISTKMEKAAGRDIQGEIGYEFGDKVKEHNEKNLIDLAVSFGLTPKQVAKMDGQIKEGLNKILKDLPKISDKIQRDEKGKKVNSFRERLEEVIGKAIKDNVKDLVNYKHVENALRPDGKAKNYDDFLYDYYNVSYNSIELANIETTKRATGSVLRYPNFFKKTGQTAKFTSTGNRANNPINIKRDVKLPEFLAHHLGIKGAKVVLDRYGVEYKESDFMTWDRVIEKMVPQQQDIRFSPDGKRASYKGERKYTIQEIISTAYAKQRGKELLKDKEDGTPSDLAKSIWDKDQLEKVIKDNYIDDVIIELQVGKPDILAAKAGVLERIKAVDAKYENKRFLADILMIRDMAGDDPEQNNPIVKIIQDWLKEGYGNITNKDVLAGYGTAKHFRSYVEAFLKNQYTEKDVKTYFNELDIKVSIKELNSIETKGILYKEKGQTFLNAEKFNNYVKYIKALAPYLPKNLTKGQMEGLLGLQQKAGTQGYSIKEMNKKRILNDVTGELVTRKDVHVYDQLVDGNGKSIIGTEVKNEYDNIKFDKIKTLAQMELAYKKVYTKEPGWEKAIEETFTKEGNEAKTEFMFAWGKIKENFIRDAKSKEDLLGRIQHLHQMGAHNSSITNGDRAWVNIETAFIPKGKELPKLGSTHDFPMAASQGRIIQLNRIKLEHLKSSLQNSFESSSAQTRLLWSKDGKNILKNYKGAYSTYDRLDIIDILGGKTNQAGLARLVLRADELGNYYTVESGFKESLRDVNWNNIAKEVGLNLRESNDAAFKDVVSEELILPTETSKIRLKNAIKNRKQTKVLHKSNVELAEKAGIMGAKDLSNSQIIDKINIKDKALSNAKKINKERKGISVLDFDDTVATSKSKVIVNAPYYGPGKMTEMRMELTPAEFAKRHAELERAGAAFDFSEFNKVIDGKKGPLFDKLQKAVDKFGNENVFILTARPQESAEAIRVFLEGMGIKFKIENITGLENGTPQAKADWVLNKAAEGYNDFYFADDAMVNVKAVKIVLDAVDVKSKVQQAKTMADKGLNEEFNKIIEKKTGIGFQKKYSPVKAKTVGANKGKFGFFIPHGAEDFLGLLYKTLAKGKTGDSQMAWYKNKLLTPYAKAEGAMSRERMAMNSDYVVLKSNLGIGKKLRSQIGEDGFTHEQAVRVWIWNKQGMKIPDLSNADLKLLTNTVEGDPKLKAHAEGTMRIMKGDSYYKPGEFWLNGSIQSDMLNVLNKVKRPRHLQEFQDNADIIFSKVNMNKLEAAFGTNYRSALDNILVRMKSGVNRQWQPDSVEGKLLNWVNGSVGTMMFLNTRSALLQTISAVNFINWHDNNPLAAAKALANVKQWSSDFNKLFNSDYLVERRKGLKININEAELAEMAKRGGVQGAINYLLKKGFILTQIADSFAIASGGASMYRNRINTYKKQKMGQKAAEKKAFIDFTEISEISQQSSRPDKISAQQASNLGRLILAFANTPLQYTRLQKRAIQDLIAGRGDTKANISKLLYYGLVQNFIFNALQQALFALGFDEESFDEREKTVRYASIANGMVDTTLRGTGVFGAAAAAIKNVMFTYWVESGKKNPDYENAAWEIFDWSPPIASKVAKIRGFTRTTNWDMDEIKGRGPWDINNPAYLASARLVSAFTNVPIDRVLQKTYNTQSALEEDREIWQRMSNISGFTDWNIGIDDEDYEKPYVPLTEEQKKILNKNNNNNNKTRSKSFSGTTTIGKRRF
jgi:hypothetical protein